MLAALVALVGLSDARWCCYAGLCIILPIVIAAFALLPAASFPSTPLWPLPTSNFAHSCTV